MNNPSQENRITTTLIIRLTILCLLLQTLSPRGTINPDDVVMAGLLLIVARTAFFKLRHSATSLHQSFSLGAICEFLHFVRSSDTKGIERALVFRETNHRVYREHTTQDFQIEPDTPDYDSGQLVNYLGIFFQVGIVAAVVFPPSQTVITSVLLIATGLTVQRYYFDFIFDALLVFLALGNGSGAEVISLYLGFLALSTLTALPISVVYLPRYKLSLTSILNHDLLLTIVDSMHNFKKWNENSRLYPFELSVVIPAYNEEKRLPDYLIDVCQYLVASKISAEVLVVDDGSKDRTADLVRSIAKCHPMVRLIQMKQNGGKGNALRNGFKEAKGRFVLMADADGATPIQELDQFLKTIKREQCEIVIANRKESQEQVERHPIRKLLGEVFYKATNLIAVPGVADTQCGFKLFRKSALDTILPFMRENGWALDIEILYLAQKSGLRIEQLPVSWKEIPGSKVNPILDGLKMLQALFRIRHRLAHS